MPRLRAALALLILLDVASAHGAQLDRAGTLRQNIARAPIAGRVLVVDDADRFRLGPHGELSAGHARLAELLSTYGLSRGAPLWRVTAPASPRFLVLTSSRPDFDPVAVAGRLRAAGLVRAAVPDLRVQLHVLPNDPDVPVQWYVEDGGFADVRLPAAWGVEQGSASARIGIMDTGVDLGHPDLATKIWTNPGEVPANGVDDDGNGYIDDVSGWDFGDADNDPNPHAVPDPATFDVDVGFHGTFVAGVAAAATNNAEGIAGAGWNCAVVPLKVVNSSAAITLAAMTEAFGYATAMQLEVLNMSLGVADSTGVAEYFQALVDAATSAGVLCVASAGNSGTGDLNYPAACSGVLSVAATDDLNARASFSNHGPTVRIAAPGAAMWSALCRNYPIDEFSLLFYEIFFGWDSFRPYMGGDGTSFSAPLVAGACALVRSRHPGWPPPVVLAHMVATGDNVAYDQPIGPKLNAYRAVTEQVVAVEPGPAPVAGLQIAPNPFVSHAIIRFDLPAGGHSRLRVFDSAGRLVRDLAGGKLAPGPQAVRWDGADIRGRPASAGLYLVRLETPAGQLVRRVVRIR